MGVAGPQGPQVLVARSWQRAATMRGAPLEGHGQLALVPGAGAGLPSRLDLGALGQVPAEAVDLLVVDHDRLVGAERADLAAAAIAIEVVALAA